MRKKSLQHIGPYFSPLCWKNCAQYISLLNTFPPPDFLHTFPPHFGHCALARLQDSVHVKVHEATGQVPVEAQCADVEQKLEKNLNINYFEMITKFVYYNFFRVIWMLS